MDVRKAFARAVSRRWVEDGVVVPTNSKRRVFVTSAVDNLNLVATNFTALLYHLPIM